MCVILHGKSGSKLTFEKFSVCTCVRVVVFVYVCVRVFILHSSFGRKLTSGKFSVYMCVCLCSCICLC